MTIRSILWTVSLFAVGIVLSACKPAPIAAVTPAVDLVGTSVAAALTAIPPRPTYTPFPTYTPYPTTDLSGLFCEYAFCINHPVDIPFFDLEVVNQTFTNHSSYTQGNLIGFNQQLTIFVAWSQLSGEFDPNSMIALMLTGDQRDGVLLTLDIHTRLVSYTKLTSTPSPDVLPFGLAAAWQCNDRQFGWKIYTAQPEDGETYLRQALHQFTCSG